MSEYTLLTDELDYNNHSVINKSTVDTNVLCRRITQAESDIEELEYDQSIQTIVAFEIVRDSLDRISGASC